MSTNWKEFELGEVLTLQRGFDLPHRERREGNVPVVSSSGASGTHSYPKVCGPGIVTGRYGTIGEVFFIEEVFWPLNTTLYVCDFKKNDPLFLFYLLHTIDFQSHSGKSGVPGVNRNDLHKLLVNLPEFEEQRAIAAALSDVDGLIEALEKLIAKKRDIKLATMQQLLTGKTRLPGFSGEWVVKQLGEVVVIQKGQLITEKTIITGSFPVIAGGKRPAYYHNKPNRNAPTITISASGANAGFVALYKVPIFASDCSTISEGSDYSLEFIYYQLLLRQDIIYKSQTGGAQPHIHPADLQPLKIPLPTIQEQQAIASVLSDMDLEIEALEQRLEKTKQIKQGMMQQLLTGRVRLV